MQGGSESLYLGTRWFLLLINIIIFIKLLNILETSVVFPESLILLIVHTVYLYVKFKIAYFY